MTFHKNTFYLFENYNIVRRQTTSPVLQKQAIWYVSKRKSARNQKLLPNLYGKYPTFVVCRTWSMHVCYLPYLVNAPLGIKEMAGNEKPKLVRALLLVIPSLLNAIGFYFLYAVRSHRRNNNQYLYLLTLSIAEILVSVHMLIKRIVINDINDVIMSGIYTWYIVLMTLLTVDRFLEVYLNIKYHLYWSPRKTKCALGISLIVPVIVPVIVTFATSSGSTRQRVIFLYIYPITNHAFMVVGIAVYGYIFKQRRKASRSLNKVLASVRSSSPYTSSSSTATKRAKGNFYIPALLMLTFYLFWVILDIVITYYVGQKKAEVLDLFSILDGFYLLGLISDALIYTLCSPYVRREIMKTFKRN